MVCVARPTFTSVEVATVHVVLGSWWTSAGRRVLVCCPANLGEGWRSIEIIQANTPNADYNSVHPIIEEVFVPALLKRRNVASEQFMIAAALNGATRPSNCHRSLCSWRSKINAVQVKIYAIAWIVVKVIMHVKDPGAHTSNLGSLVLKKLGFKNVGIEGSVAVICDHDWKHFPSTRGNHTYPHCP